MNRSILKMTWRTIRTFFGRYMALLLIVALSAGFFAGLKITRDAMVNTGNQYLASQNFYDFRLLSAMGFTQEDADAFETVSGVEAAEGSYSTDLLMVHGGSQQPMKLISLPESVNLPSLSAGRMPRTETECLADDERFTEEDIGTTISVSGDNEENAASLLTETEYTIVGLTDSPIYLGLDRGTTDIGNGAIYAYLYLPKENFTSQVYTEINLSLSETADIYTDEYEELIEKYREEITQLCSQRANDRYEELLEQQELLMQQTLQGEAAVSNPETGHLSEADWERNPITETLSKPEIYVLTREENAGYVSFENDTAIISGIANIFPLFFILIAMFVCITTMTRMVDEERTQIGVLKALGLTNGAIMAKYLLYAGSATLIGWTAGFFLCTWGLPQIFWFAYSSLYDFTPMPYLLRPVLAAATLAVSLTGILGSTYMSCKNELGSVPASLIRPRAAKNGKRILLERLSPLWKRLTFLQKITLRNMFRYKRRMFMMLLGVSCCCALVVTAFGVRDSMIDIGTLQFEKIQTYDLEASFAAGTEDELCRQLEELEEVEDFCLAGVQRVDLSAEETMNSVTLMSFDETEKLASFWDFHQGGETLAFPAEGEILINRKIADRLSLSVGDSLTIRTGSLETETVRVSGIFDNYIYNYAVISAETWERGFEEWQANTIFVTAGGDPEQTAEKLTALDEITSVSQLSNTRKNVDDALSCLDYIIWLIVLFSGALAFIVIYNLTNINLAERSREIATVQVLGFYPKETDSYVLRENLVLSALASVIGMPLGVLFHYAVMTMIQIDSMAFDRTIRPVSFVLAFFCTLLFAVIVNFVMKRQIGRIQMAESLKAVE
ncbi:MAG: ABC transporter permease [Lachnospiraceae bacterium]|nr:ABC transporter permease [Lachnospiraceae bacterium]